MPLRDRSPFDDHTAHLDAAVNPYVTPMRHALEEKPATPEAHLIWHGPKLKDCRGHWRKQLGLPADGKLLVEIGCHKGKNLLELAHLYPQAHCLGIDITLKRVVLTAQRAVVAGLANLSTIFANAKSLDLLFAPGEVDGYLVFYPDPWLKRRKAKNRLLDQSLANKLATTLKPGGFCWLKTDQAPYFEESRKAFLSVGLTCTSTPAELATGLSESTFERRFRHQGIPPNSGYFIKNK